MYLWSKNNWTYWFFLLSNKAANFVFGVNQIFDKNVFKNVHL